MFQLSNLTRLVKKRKRVGRGGSRGGTSGRGHKGQRARSGGKSNGRDFEGGQMPLSRRLPKRGFNNVRFATPVKIINLDTLERIFSDGESVTRELLIERGVLKGSKPFKIKILGQGSLSKKLQVHVDAVSDAAQKAIVASGGQLTLIKEK